MREKLQPWTLLDQSLLQQTRIFRLNAERWRSPRTGQEHVFTNVAAPDWVNVVAIDTEDRMLLVRQFRFGTRAFTLEVPGGMCDPDEAPVAIDAKVTPSSSAPSPSASGE